MKPKMVKKMKPIMEEATVKQRTKMAISAFCERESYLLKHNLGERCLTHRLAIYLGMQFPEWDVDCEYNRNGDKVKEVDYLKRDDNTWNIDSPVIPDIIVHHRGDEEPEKNNLLVIEARRFIANPKKAKAKFDRDSNKIESYLSFLSYHHGLLIEFHFEEGKPIHQPDWRSNQRLKLKHSPSPRF